MATKRDAEKVARKFGGYIDGGYEGNGSYRYNVEAPAGWAWGGDLHSFVVMHGVGSMTASEAWQDVIERMEGERPEPCLATCGVCYPAQQFTTPNP